MSPNNTVSPSALRLKVDPDTLGFAHTGEIAETVEVVGQERAVEAIRFGLAVANPDFHVFAAGDPGTGKSTIAPLLARDQARKKPTPPDQVLLHNFTDTDSPVAIVLPTGRGKLFQREMRKLVDALRRSFHNAFLARDYRGRQQSILEKALDERRVHLDALNERARTVGLVIEDSPDSLQMLPLKDDGTEMTTEEYSALPEPERRAIEDKERGLRSEILAYLDEARRVQDAADDALDKLSATTAQRVVQPAIARLRRKLGAIPALDAWLKSAAEDMIATFESFLPAETDPTAEVVRTPPVTPPAARYEVNVLVDNSQCEGAPVVFELNPTYANLVGRIERKMAFGALETDHTLVRAGALVRASGGYLLLNARDVAGAPFAWAALKRALREHRCVIEDADDGVAMNAISLEPIAVPLDVRVILLGDIGEYEMLRNLDPDFAKLFKVRADFDAVTDRTSANVDRLCRFVASRARSLKLRHFDASGVAAIVELCSRLAGRQDELSLELGYVTDLMIEADYVAGVAGSEFVRREHVDGADEFRKRREGGFRDQVLREFSQRYLLVAVDGEHVGQVNGLSVLSVGDMHFGIPCRITAKTFAGSSGVVNIERETELSGQIHSKAVLILLGYLGSLYAQQRALALSASITFEQNYTEIEGDSATLAEAVALLSSIARLPVRQDIAVTGSMSQHGEVQPIGGVNEKIEGFFEVCSLRGLTGQQGVIVPEYNVPELHLAQRVVDAVAAGRFHIWYARHIDEVIERMTGVEAGKPNTSGKYPARSVHGRVHARLRAMSERDSEKS